MKIILSQKVKNRMQYMDVGHHRMYSPIAVSKNYKEKLWIITQDFQIHVKDFSFNGSQVHMDFSDDILNRQIAKGRSEENLETGEIRVSLVIRDRRYETPINKSIIKNILKRTFPGCDIYEF